MAEIDLSSIEPNSFKEREKREQQKRRSETAPEVEKKALAPVVSKGGIVSTKTPFLKRVKNMVFSKDPGDVKVYIIKDWLLPTMKNGVLEILGYMFDVDVSPKRRDRGRPQDYERTSYSSYYSGNSRRSSSDSRSNSRKEDTKVDYRAIVLYERREAERVVDSLHNQIDEEGAVSIADLFNLVGLNNDYTDNNWGWTDKRDIGIRRTRDGFLIDVSEASYLE